MWVLLLVAGCSTSSTPLGVTLQDGQVMVGEVTTASLRLSGVFGEVDVPLSDVGVILPVEAATLGESHGQVTVWLRNGSEFRGKWENPELGLSVSAGGESIPVDLPTDQVQGIQLRGGEEWPDGSLYRIRTTHGDDVLVDPAETRISVKNALGTFAPFLSECARVGPIGDPRGDWRLELRSGTVLVGPLTQDHLVLALPSGPETLEVPLGELVAIDQQIWSGGGKSDYFASTPSAAQNAAEAQPLPPTSGRQGLGSAEGWFDNSRLKDAKR
jgi:hypothetical protein